ncbi:MAG: tetratricopeptide repeat protein [Chloroflexota bacterium]
MMANTPAERIQLLETRVEDARAQNNVDTLIAGLFELGQAYLDTGDTPKALTQFEEGIQFCHKSGDELSEARFWGFKGICLVRLGNAHFAQIAFYKSLKMARALDYKSLIVDALTQIGSLLLDTDQPEKAISKYEQALAEALNTGEQRRVMLIASKIGGIFLGLESLEKAMDYYAMALQTAQALGDRRAECVYHINIGNVLFANHEMEAANDHFEQALNLAMDLEDAQVEISALSNLLRTSIAADKSSMALLYGESVIRQAAAVHEPAIEIANIHALTSYLMDKGQYRKAQPYLERGLVLAEGQQDWDWQLTVLLNLGNTAYQLERLPQAADYYRQGLVVAGKALNNLVEAQLLGRLSAVQADMGELETAVLTARKALDLAQQLENPVLIGEQQMLLSFTHSELTQTEEAIAYAQAATQTYRASGQDALAEQAAAFAASLSEQ